MGGYKPYNNTLSLAELKTLCNLHRKEKGRSKENLERILRKYGSEKLEI